LPAMYRAIDIDTDAEAPRSVGGLIVMFGIGR
jgi:hypothetical protein